MTHFLQQFLNVYFYLSPPRETYFKQVSQYKLVTTYVMLT